MKCKNCDIEHDGSFGSGCFCSKKCANTRKHSDISASKISTTLKRHYGKNPKPKIIQKCDKCGEEYEGWQRKERKKHCKKCRLKRVHYKLNPESILDVSKRTAAKILKRASIGCAICGWKEGSCDIHHIISKKRGGTNKHINLVIGWLERGIITRIFSRQNITRYI
jgi:predicted molibdopterin-dependent oxidoreductase YjgC